jgi:multiple sugar transport system permease protein
MYGPRERRSSRVLRVVVLSVFAAIALIPIIWLFLATFKTEADLFTLPPPLLFRPTLQNYRYIVEEGKFLLYLRNSSIIAACTIVLAVSVGSIGAYSLERGRYRGKGPISYFVLLFRMIPAIAIVIPIFLVVRQVGLINTRIVLILAYTAFNLPFITWMMRGYIRTIPREMEEAASIDGATRWQIMLRVVFPVSTPGILSTSIFAFLLCWNEFVVSLSLTNTSKAATLPIYVLGFITPQGLIWGELAASTFLMIIPAILFGVFAQRFIVEGLRAGISR